MMDCKSDRPAGGWGWGRRLQDKLVRGGGVDETVGEGLEEELGIGLKGGTGPGSEGGGGGTGGETYI